MTPEQEKRLAELEAEEARSAPQMTAFDKALFTVRSAAEGHTAGISEPVVSAVKAGVKSIPSLGTGFGGAFNREFNADVSNRRMEKAANPGLDAAAQVSGALLPSPINVVGKAVRGGTAFAKAVGPASKALLPTLTRGAIGGGMSGLVTQGIKEAVQVPTGFSDADKAASNIAGATLIGGAIGAPAEAAVQGLTNAGKARLLAKPDKAKVIKAGEALGATPTPGQLSDPKTAAGKLVRDLESSLEQTPNWGIGVNKIKTSVAKAKNAPNEALESLGSLSTGKTATEVGASVRSGVLSKVKEKIAPAKEIYERLQTSLAKSQASIQNSNNVIAEATELAATQPIVGSDASQASKVLGNVQTVEHLKNVRTWVKDMLNSPQVQESGIRYNFYSKLNDALTKDRVSSLLAASPESADDLAKADKLYSEAAMMIKDALPFQKAGPSSIGRVMERTNDTALPDKLFNAGDVNRLEAMAKNFPKQFAELRQNRVRDILDKAGENPNALVRQVRQLEPEAKAMIFGKDAAAKIDAIEEWAKSMPSKVGPSGTPQGNEVSRFFLNTISMMGPLESSGKAFLYNALTAPKSPILRRATGAASALNDAASAKPMNIEIFKRAASRKDEKKNRPQ